jgi:hypothetical protein
MFQRGYEEAVENKRYAGLLPVWTLGSMPNISKHTILTPPIRGLANFNAWMATYIVKTRQRAAFMYIYIESGTELN